MKKYFIIRVFIIFIYISSSSDIYDISLFNEYIIDPSKFQESIIPLNTSFYFRMKINDEINNNFQIIIKSKKLNRESFILKVGYFNDKPDDTALNKEEKWEFVEYFRSDLFSDIYRNIYNIRFKENTKYILISVQLNETLDFNFNLDEKEYLYIDIQSNKQLYELSSNLDYPEDNQEEEFIIYNITNSEELEIDVKKLNDSKSKYFTLKSTTKKEGDIFLKLKVNKDISKDLFYLGGYGNENYITPSDGGNPKDLGLKYDHTFLGEKYDIHQYYFKADKSLAFFTINIFVRQNIDYLSVKVDSKSEGKPDENGKKENQPKKGLNSIVMIFIIIACILLVFVVLLVILKKTKIMGAKNKSSDNIEIEKDLIES